MITVLARKVNNLVTLTIVFVYKKLKFESENCKMKNGQTKNRKNSTNNNVLSKKKRRKNPKSKVSTSAVCGMFERGTSGRGCSIFAGRPQIGCGR
jgi:hypothetical protein